MRRYEFWFFLSVFFCGNLLGTILCILYAPGPVSVRSMLPTLGIANLLVLGALAAAIAIDYAGTHLNEWHPRFKQKDGGDD